MARLGVLAMGNVLRGDDGVGLAALEALRTRYELGPEVELRDLGLPGADLALALEGLEAAWVVDAVRGGTPGALVRFEVGPLPVEASEPGGHGATVRGALRELAAAGVRAPAPTVLIGVCAGHFDLGAGLSPPVRAALAALVETLAAELRAAGASARRRPDLCDRVD